jgi:hypothetical protein
MATYTPLLPVPNCPGEHPPGLQGFDPSLELGQLSFGFRQLFHRYTGRGLTDRRW